MNSRHVLLMLGPNGCGKGTTGSCLRAMGAQVEITSDILRTARTTHPCSDVRETITRYQDELHLNVPCHITVEAVLDKLRHSFREQPSGLIVVDGAPRTVIQAKEIPQRIKLKKPEVHVDFLFLRLPMEAAMERIRKRVEEDLMAGKPVRSSDLGDNPEKRYQEYIEVEDRLIETAQKSGVASTVTIIDLLQHTTLEAAAKIWGSLYQVSPDDVAVQMRSRIQLVA